MNFPKNIPLKYATYVNKNGKVVKRKSLNGVKVCIKDKGKVVFEIE